jgi:pyruvate/2-oxoglutarate dehydrogenase complex dihydrolipoamide dehydrogenase (E3) component
MRVAIAERDRLGGECNFYGCVPTKVMLRSAKIAALARDAGRFGVRIPSVLVDLPAVQQRARDVIDAQSGEGAAPFERAGIRVFMQEAVLTGPHRIELADGTQVEADRVVLTTGTEATIPPIEGLSTDRSDEQGGDLKADGASPSSRSSERAIGVEFARSTTVRDTGHDPRGLPHILPAEDEEAAAPCSGAGGGRDLAPRGDASTVRATQPTDGRSSSGARRS